MFGLWTLLGIRNEDGLHSLSEAVMIAPDFFNSFMTKLRSGESFTSNMIKEIQELKTKQALIFALCASNHWAVAFVAKGLDRENGILEYFYLPLDSHYSDPGFQSNYSDCISAIQSLLRVVHGYEMQKLTVEVIGVQGQPKEFDQELSIIKDVHGQLHGFNTDVVDANGAVLVRPRHVVLSPKLFVGESPVSLHNKT